MSSAGVSAGCGFRFCSGCLVPWVGSGSVYLKGRLAHLPSCKHHFHLCSACNRKEHPEETCDEYAIRLKPIADAEDRKNKCAPGERHWETSHGALNRFEMSRTYVEREEAKKARKRSAKTSQRGESKKLKTEA
ncbi:hypothetical protein Slin14017_G066950 [Septoria linicola]|nr:hypothetical protein Slin14017_G066950 [Septoria linicola]